jgi:hypothetical protein
VLVGFFILKAFGFNTTQCQVVELVNRFDKIVFLLSWFLTMLDGKYILESLFIMRLLFRFICDLLCIVLLRSTWDHL